MQRLPIAILCIVSLFALTPAGLGQGKVYRNVTNEGLEKIVQSFEAKYEKAERKDKDATVVFFEFKRGGQSYRLYNYVSDLWIECIHEKPMKAEDINRWNAAAKFSRLVQVTQKDKTFLSLEAQLDCVGGVTDTVIRQFIVRFEEEAQRFAKFAK